MDCKFVVGQNVTPIEPPTWRDAFTGMVTPGPSFGEILAIASMHTDNATWNSDGAIVVWLSFAEYPGIFGNREFKPVDEIKTDISIFTRMQIPKIKQKELEDA